MNPQSPAGKALKNIRDTIHLAKMSDGDRQLLLNRLLLLQQEVVPLLENCAREIIQLRHATDLLETDCNILRHANELAENKIKELSQK